MTHAGDAARLPAPDELPESLRKHADRKPPNPRRLVIFTFSVILCMAVVIGGIVLAVVALSDDEKSSTCGSMVFKYDYCTITSSPETRTRHRLDFNLDESRSKYAQERDSYSLESVEGDTATFWINDEQYTCQVGQTIPIGRGFAECRQIEGQRATVRLYIGDPPD